jgi:glyoxylase-like metal-dependent hydrolase (beta-lactamase superfamily II)
VVIVAMKVTGVAQRNAWSERVLPPVEQLAADLWSIPVVIPHNPLRYVSVYALAIPNGLVTIDAGWACDQSWSDLTAGLASIGASPNDVRGVLATHMHVDHLGLAGRIRAESGAWIALHPADSALLDRPDFSDDQTAVDSDILFLQEMGASVAEAVACAGSLEAKQVVTQMGRADRQLIHGELVDVPGWRIRGLHTPGHTPGHMTFYNERSRILFSGDHVLPRITPNISLSRGIQGNPLSDYLESLRAVRSLDTVEVYPAHEWRFSGLAARVDEILAHHEARLAELLEVIRRHPHSTPWEVAPELKWSRDWSEYQGRHRVFAVTETAAHLKHLVTRGLVVAQSNPDGPSRYSIARER